MAEELRTSHRNLQTAEKILVRASRGRKTIAGFELSCIIDELTKRDPSLIETDKEGKTRMSKIREMIEIRKII